MSVSMNHLYFKEPNGIYKTLKGFSMGVNSAARGSEKILRIFELKIFKKLHDQKLHKNVNRYLRFRDDVSLHVTGNTETMLKIVKIITTELKTLEWDILNPDLLTYREIKFMRKTSHI